MMNTALHKAKMAAGGTAALARILGLTSQAVSQWDRVPASRVLEVERVSGISRHDLRPDVFGPSSTEEAA